MTDQKPARFASLFRLVVRLLVALAIGYGAYLLLANLFLATALAEVVNQQPERRRVSWQSGYSLVPGRFTLSGFRFEQHTPRGDLEVELAGLGGRIELAALLERRLRIVGVKGQGFSFDWRGPREPLAPSAGDVAGPGTEPEAEPREPSTGPEATESKASPKRRRRLLAVELEEVVIEGLDHVLIQGMSHLVPAGDGGARGKPGLAGLRLEGKGGLRGRLVVDHEGRLWLDTELTIRDGQLFDEGQHQAEVSDFTIHLAINGWHPKEERGLDALPHVSGSLSLEAASADLALLAPLVGGGKGVTIEGRGDRLDVELHLVAGRLTPGSHLQVASQQGEVGFLDYRARGSASIEGKVEDDGQGIVLRCTLDDYALQRTGLEQPHLRGTGFEVRAEYPSTLLHTSVVRQATVKVKWPKAEFPDLALYNVFLPAEKGVKILAGHGTVEADFTLALEDSQGRVALEAEGVELRLDDLELAGELSLETHFGDLDWSAGRVPVGKSRLELSDVSITDTSGKHRLARNRSWWARLQVVEGTLGRDLSFEGDLDALFRDTGPLLALFRRKKLPGFVEDALRIDDVQARLLLKSDRRTLALDDIEIDGKGLEVRGRFHLAEQRDGLLYLKLHGIALAAEVTGDDLDLHLLHPKRWFEKRYAETMPSETAPSETAPSETSPPATTQPPSP